MRQAAVPKPALLHEGADAATTKNTLADSTAQVGEALQDPGCE